MRRRAWCTSLCRPLLAGLTLAVTAVLVSAVPGTILAQETALPDIRVSLVTDRTELTVGDPIGLTVEVNHPGDNAVVMPTVGPRWGAFEVRRQSAARIVENGDGTRTTVQQLEVTLFAPGMYETPDLLLSIRRPDGSVEQVFPESLRLTVLSVLSGEDETLRDIRAPADFSTPFWKQPYVRLLLVTAGGGTVLLGLGLGFYRRARRNRETSATEVRYRTPWQIAVEELDRVESLELASHGDVKEHYALVSRALRAYIQSAHIEDAGPVDAVDLTTDEIGAALRLSSLDDGKAAEVVDLLAETDLVKFANYTPTESQASAVLASVRSFIEDTRLDTEAGSGENLGSPGREAPA